MVKLSLIYFFLLCCFAAFQCALKGFCVIRKNLLINDSLLNRNATNEIGKNRRMIYREREREPSTLKVPSLFKTDLIYSETRGEGKKSPTKKDLLQRRQKIDFMINRFASSLMCIKSRSKFLPLGLASSA